MATILAVRHLAFEDLGVFGDVFAGAGHAIEYVDAWAADWDAIAARPPGLLAVLGGPIGVYETGSYPFLAPEIAAVGARIGAGLPTLGICLGAQIIAASQSARVYPAGVKEIGLAALSLTAQGATGALSAYVDAPLAFHWHGDTFDLPNGAQLLASTEAVAHQAFGIGDHVFATQFHPEMDLGRIEPWLVGHACELVGAGIDPTDLRQSAAAHAEAMRGKAERVAASLLAQFRL